MSSPLFPSVIPMVRGGTPRLNSLWSLLEVSWSVSGDSLKLLIVSVAAMSSSAVSSSPVAEASFLMDTDPVLLVTSGAGGGGWRLEDIERDGDFLRTGAGLSGGQEDVGEGLEVVAVILCVVCEAWVRPLILRSSASIRKELRSSWAMLTSPW